MKFRVKIWQVPVHYKLHVKKSSQNTIKQEEITKYANEWNTLVKTNQTKSLIEVEVRPKLIMTNKFLQQKETLTLPVYYKQT